MTFNLSVRESIAVLVYRHSKTRMPTATYMTLATWLDVESYIPPSSRVLNESALSLPILSKYDLFANYHYLNILETHLTSSEQSNVIRYILCHMNHPISLILES